MTELLDFAAQLARGEMHPSAHVEDYRKGTGRAEFAAMAGDYGDRCRRKVRILKEAAERIAELERELAEAREDRLGARESLAQELRDVLRLAGAKWVPAEPCDLIPAFTQALAAAERRERELAEAREDLDKAIFGGALRRCDIPACNCNGYHSEYAQRMLEIAEERDAAERRGWDAAIQVAAGLDLLDYVNESTRRKEAQADLRAANEVGAPMASAAVELYRAAIRALPYQPSARPGGE